MGKGPLEFVKGNGCVSRLEGLRGTTLSVWTRGVCLFKKVKQKGQKKSIRVGLIPRSILKRRTGKELIWYLKRLRV